MSQQQTPLEFAAEALAETLKNAANMPRGREDHAFSLYESLSAVHQGALPSSVHKLIRILAHVLSFASMARVATLINLARIAGEEKARRKSSEPQTWNIDIVKADHGDHLTYGYRLDIRAEPTGAFLSPSAAGEAALLEMLQRDNIQARYRILPSDIEEVSDTWDKMTAGGITAGSDHA